MDNDAFHEIQAEQTIRSLPLLVFFHGCASFCVHLAVNGSASDFLKTLWVGITLAAGLPFIAIFLAWQRGYFRHRAVRAKNLLELSGLLLGVAWALPTAVYATTETVTYVLPVILISLAMMGITVLSLLHVPVAAVVFTALLTAAITRSAYMAIVDYRIMAGAVIAIYGAVLIGVTLVSHSAFIRRAQTELQLKQQKDFVSLLLSNFEQGSQDWLWETDRNGVLVYASHRLSEFLGKDEMSLIGKSFRALLVSKVEPGGWEEFEEAFVGETEIKPVLLKARDSVASILVTAQAMHDGSGAFAGWRGMGRDMSALVEAEKRANTALAAAEATSAAKSRFLAIVSHELRTPIHAIVGYADLLARDKDVLNNDKTRREFCESIQGGAYQLQALINDILDATRLERGTLRLVEQDADAAELVESAIRLCRTSAEAAGVSLVGKLVEGVALHVDLARLKQALNNLLTNAIKFSPEGGVVYVEMLRHGSGLVIEVRDAGAGIAPEDIERLFEPFGQIDDSLARQHGGLGLGLAIARRIVRLHDGDVTLKSTPGGGTTASLRLPAERVNWAARTPQQIERKIA